VGPWGPCRCAGGAGSRGSSFARAATSRPQSSAGAGGNPRPEARLPEGRRAEEVAELAGLVLGPQGSRSWRWQDRGRAVQGHADGRHEVP